MDHPIECNTVGLPRSESSECLIDDFTDCEETGIEQPLTQLTQLALLARSMDIEAPPGLLDDFDPTYLAATPPPVQKRKAQERAYYIDWMRGFGIVMVVLYHGSQTIPIPAGTPKWQIDRRNGFMKVLGSFGLIAFFFCAGRAQAFGRVKFREFVITRSLRLLVPFLFALPLCLQPAQYIACSNGFHLLGCSNAYRPGMFYLTFIESWFDNIGTSLVNLHWLWFLPCIFFNDVMNYGTQRLLTYFFEGGWHNEQPTPDELTEMNQVWTGGFEFLYERPDVIYALCLQILFQIGTAVFLGNMAQFWLLFWTVQITLIYLLKRTRETKRYEYWFLAQSILPVASMFCAIFGTADTILQTYAIFTFFTNYGFILQLCEPFLESKVAGSGRSVKPLIAGLLFFLLCLTFPTSESEEVPSVPPLYMNSASPIAALELARSWLMITVADILFKAILNTPCDKLQYHHFTQFCKIAYVVHMLFLVMVIVYVNRNLPHALSYPVRWFIDVALTIWCSSVVYAILLNYQTTRSIFGLRRYSLPTESPERRGPDLLAGIPL